LEGKEERCIINRKERGKAEEVPGILLTKVETTGNPYANWVLTSPSGGSGTKRDERRSSKIGAREKKGDTPGRGEK